MISKGFFAYILIALGVVPCLTANPITPSDFSPAPLTTASGHLDGPELTAEMSSGNSNSSNAAAEKKPAPSNALNTSSNITTKDVTPNSNSAPHSGNTLISTDYSPTSNTSSTPAAHDHNPSYNAEVLSSNSTTHSSSNEKSENAKAVPTSENFSHVEPSLPPIPTCYNKKKSNGIKTHHCEKALEKVVYGANQTLDKFSGLISAYYKTCSINVYKPQNATLTKNQVETMVRSVTEACHFVGGLLFSTSRIAAQVERSTAENTYEVDTAICKKEDCPLTQGDCLSAFNQIPLDSKKRFALKKGTPSFSRLTSGNCTVTISTTDYSSFDISREHVYPTMKKLVNECGSHPGKIYISGGALGFNGDLQISTRFSNRGLCV